MSDAQKKVHGRVNLHLSARELEELDTGGQLRVRQFTNGFPALGNTFSYEHRFSRVQALGFGR